MTHCDERYRLPHLAKQFLYLHTRKSSQHKVLAPCKVFRATACLLTHHSSPGSHSEMGSTPSLTYISSLSDSSKSINLILCSFKTTWTSLPILQKCNNGVVLLLKYFKLTPVTRGLNQKEGSSHTHTEQFGVVLLSFPCLAYCMYCIIHIATRNRSSFKRLIVSVCI